MGLLSAIAFSWGVLLLVADRKPVERRWILVPTMLVVTLITLARIRFSLEGTIDFSVPLLLFAIAVLALMGYSYYYTGKHDAGRQ